MRKAFFTTLLALSCFCLMNSRPVMADGRRNLVKDALTRSLCFQKYWLGWGWEDGATVPLAIKFEGKKFYVWANDLPSVGEDDYLVNVFINGMMFSVDPADRPQKEKRVHFAAFFEGRIKDGKGVIAKYEGFNLAAGRPFPQIREFKERFVSGYIMKDMLTIPSDCTPRYDPPTPQKELMVKTVVSTMKMLLNGYSRDGISKYPPEVKIVIADFNTDYPYTYVLVEPAKELYTVVFHDPEDYDNDEYGRDGEYGTGEEYHLYTYILTQIRENGIVRKIAITP